MNIITKEIANNIYIYIYIYIYMYIHLTFFANNIDNDDTARILANNTIKEISREQYG